MLRNFIAASAILTLAACAKPDLPTEPSIEISGSAPLTSVAIVVPNRIVAESLDGSMYIDVNNIGIKGSQGGGFHTVAEIIFKEGQHRNDMAIDGIWNIVRNKRDHYVFFNRAPDGHIRYAGLINKGDDPEIVIDDRMANPNEILAMTRTVLGFGDICDELARNPWKHFKPAQRYTAPPGDHTRTVGDSQGILETVEQHLTTVRRPNATPSLSMPSPSGAS